MEREGERGGKRKGREKRKGKEKEKGERGKRKKREGGDLEEV